MRAYLVGLVVALGLASSAGCGLTLDLEPDPDGGDGADLGVPPRGDLGTDPVDAGNRCEGAEDGTECVHPTAAYGICLDGACVPGECGDGYTTGPELCDDGNTDDGDGCQATCRPGCEGDAECPSSECSTGSCQEGRCVPVAVDDGVDCLGGVCRSGMCVALTCGNGTLDLDEACDDGNTIDDDGCDNDCTPSCTTSEECRDGIACNGVESCITHDGGGATCEAADILPALPRVCDYCDERTGMFELQDADGDGYSPIEGDGCGPRDCNDADPTIYPGAPETTAGVDSNCDGTIATDVGLRLCYRDADMDGFGDPAESAAIADASCPDGFVPAGPPDCNDMNGSVHPAQIMFFQDEWCGATGGACTYDYNCDGREERKIVQRASCLGTTREECEAGREGWAGRTIPDCGESAFFGECQWTLAGCVLSLLPDLLVQSCR